MLIGISNNIPINKEFREDARSMCNLSVDIEEKSNGKDNQKGKQQSDSEYAQAGIYPKSDRSRGRSES